MKAICIERFGGPDVLRFGELSRPPLKAGQVLVEVRAASVNPRDWLLREGRYIFRYLMRGFPLVLGSDVSGVVAESGPGASRFKPGHCFFESGDVSHTAHNRTKAPIVLLNFELLAATHDGPSAIPVPE